MRTDHALVLFSGGQDSTIALAWALEHFGYVETIGFDYGQENVIELAGRDDIRRAILDVGKGGWADRLKADHIVPIALRRPSGHLHGEISPAFVPGRNLEFFLQAAMLAYRRGLGAIIGGMCQADAVGFPDCRLDTIAAMQIAVNLGMETTFRFEAPLVHLDKAASWWLAWEIGGERLVELVRERTHTCYHGGRGARHVWGYGCGNCAACCRRYEGWAQFCKELRS